MNPCPGQPRAAGSDVGPLINACKTAAPKLTKDGAWQNETNLTIRLPINLREELRAAAIRQGLKSSVIARKILMDHFVREGAR